jgi:predicted ABC-type sugar transport system permease subunit
MLNQCAVEAQRSFMRVFFAAIAVALAVVNGTKLAIIAGALDPSWLATGQRAFGVILGTTLALLGNYLPKLVSPWSLRDEPFDWQGVHRFGGWLCLTVGVAVVVCWLALPVGSARSATSSLILTMAVLLLGRKLYSLATWQ